jgi:hypothetical protein
MQHLNSHYREGDVEDEAKTENLLLRCAEGIDVNLLLRCAEGIDVGTLAERRFHERDRPFI